MYKRLDNHKDRIKKPALEDVISAVNKRDLEQLRETYYNIFEEVLDEDSYYIEKAKRVLLKRRGLRGFLAGSGPSIFCTLKDEEDAMKMMREITNEKGIDIFLAKTYRGGIYGNNRG